MNIFDIYQNKIKKILLKLKSDELIILPESMQGIRVDMPPPNFNYDISTNVLMVLSKINQKSPLDLSTKLISIMKNEDEFIDNIVFAKPGFINIKFKLSFWNKFVEEILINHETFGVNTKEQLNNFMI